MYVIEVDGLMLSRPPVTDDKNYHSYFTDKDSRARKFTSRQEAVNSRVYNKLHRDGENPAVRVTA